MALPILEPKQGNTFSLFVVGGTYDELKTVFDKLAVEADRDKRTFIELHNVPFGTSGQLTGKTRSPGFLKVKRKNKARKAYSRFTRIIPIKKRNF